MPIRRPILCAALAGSMLAAASPAFAEEPYYPEDVVADDSVYSGEWDGAWEEGDADYSDGWSETHAPEGGYYAPDYGTGLPPQPGEQRFSYGAEEREAWLAECRRRYDDEDGLGGALIGGVIGGVAGNRIAGRGNRTVGTIAGAAVGAVAGAAIDEAEDRGRVRDACEDYLERYEAGYSAQAYGYGQPPRPAYHGGEYGYAYGPGPAPGYYGYGYGYGSAPVMWVPMVVGMDCKPKKVVKEVWEDVPPARRAIPSKVQPVKTIPVQTKTKLVPTKSQPTKYVK